MFTLDISYNLGISCGWWHDCLRSSST